MSRNIVDVYKEFNKQLIIVISGLSGCGKTEIGMKISRDFKINYLNAQKYYKKDFNDRVKLPNNKYIVNYDTDDAIDWDSLNAKINEEKTKGIVIVGTTFSTEKLMFNVDFHIHLKISKQEIKKKIHEFIEKHPEKNFDEESENLRLNMYTYPYYLELLKRMKITKFIDVTGMTEEKIYDIVFDEIIKHINDNVYQSKNTFKNKINATSESSDYNTNAVILPGETNVDDDYYISYHTIDE